MKCFSKASEVSVLWIGSQLLLSSAFALSTIEKASLESSIKHYVTSWNEAGGKGFSEVYEESSDFVNIFGARFSGKSEIEQRHVEILQSFLKGSKLEVTGIDLKELTPEIVIAWVKWRLDGFRTPRSDQAKPGEIREGIFTQVFRKNGSKWLIVTSQNTMSPMPM